MNRNDFNNFIDKIRPADEVKENIWEKIHTSRKSSLSTRTWLSLAASLILICLVIYSIPVIAAEIQARLLQKMPAYEPLAEQIETNIFSKTDDHLCITVDELLSDGMGVYMLVRYTALDDIGREWLSEYTYPYQGYNLQLNLQPYIEDYSVSATNYSFPTFEQNELATENERYFILSLETTSRDYDSNQGIFNFPMTSQNESVIIDIESNVEILSYELHSNVAISDLYQPTYMEISPMSFVIYAKNNGVYKRIGNSEQWLIPNEEFDLLSKSSYLIMEDGSKHQLFNTSSCTTTPKETNHYSDLVLLSGFFKEYSDEYLEKIILIDPHKVIGLELKGIKYSFKK